MKVTLVEEDLRPYFPDKRTTTPDVKKGIFEALALRQKLQERQAAAQGKAKPPDKPAAGGDDKNPAGPGPEKKPEPAAVGAKKPSSPAAGKAKKPSGPTAGGKAKKPSTPMPKKSGPAR